MWPRAALAQGAMTAHELLPRGLDACRRAVRADGRWQQVTTRAVLGELRSVGD